MHDSVIRWRRTRRKHGRMATLPLRLCTTTDDVTAVPRTSTPSAFYPTPASFKTIGDYTHDARTMFLHLMCSERKLSQLSPCPYRLFHEIRAGRVTSLRKHASVRADVSLMLMQPSMGRILTSAACQHLAGAARATRWCRRHTNSSCSNIVEMAASLAKTAAAAEKHSYIFFTITGTHILRIGNALGRAGRKM